MRLRVLLVSFVAASVLSGVWAPSQAFAQVCGAGIDLTVPSGIFEYPNPEGDECEPTTFEETLTLAHDNQPSTLDTVYTLIRMRLDCSALEPDGSCLNGNLNATTAKNFEDGSVVVSGSGTNCDDASLTVTCADNADAAVACNSPSAVQVFFDFTPALSVGDMDACEIAYDVTINRESPDANPTEILQSATSEGDCPPDLTGGESDSARFTLSCEDGHLNNYKCYSAKPEPGTGFVQKEVELTDQFAGTTVATVITPFEICNPVRKEGLEDDTDQDLNGPGEPHLMCYKLLAPNAIGPDVLARLTDQFGSLTHRIGDSVVLCQPALKSCFDRAVEQLVDEGVDPDEALGLAEQLCDVARLELDQKLAHFNCYQSFEQRDEAGNPTQPFGQCSDTVQVCDVDADCPGAETCVELSPPVPYDRPLLLELTDQWGTTLSTIDETSLHCNPLTQKVVDGGTPEDFVPPLFPTDGGAPFPVPDGVNIEEEEVHYRCYLIDDDGPPDALEDDPLNRRILVEDQFGTNPIRVGIGTRLCEPAVKELLEEKPQTRACGLFGIEALLGLVPLALLRRRREGRH